MGKWIEVVAEDGHRLSTYVAQPSEPAIGSIVLVQEIFGVNAHIRGVADGYANDGFTVIVPALFDRIERHVELEYEGEDLKKAYDFYPRLIPEKALLDIVAAYGYAKELEKGIGILGYCFGGLMSWLTATRGESFKVRPSCCIGYYPGGIGTVATEEPSCPVMLHFGGNDSHVGRDQVDAVRLAHPEVEIFVYDDADHAFNCEMRASYDASSAALARQRTLAFLKAHVA